jgi:hypothetical protein
LTAQFTMPATRVFVMNLPVLLISSQAICAPTGTPLIVSMTQVRVSGQ